MQIINLWKDITLLCIDWHSRETTQELINMMYTYEYIDFPIVKEVNESYETDKSNNSNGLKQSITGLLR